jgi:hypothetical protein
MVLATSASGGLNAVGSRWFCVAVEIFLAGLTALIPTRAAVAFYAEGDTNCVRLDDCDYRRDCVHRNIRRR